MAVSKHILLFAQQLKQLADNWKEVIATATTDAIEDQVIRNMATHIGQMSKELQEYAELKRQAILAQEQAEEKVEEKPKKKARKPRAKKSK